MDSEREGEKEREREIALIMSHSPAYSMRSRMSPLIV